MGEFSILVLVGEAAICNLKTFLINIAKREQETTEKEEKQRKRAHERELQMEKKSTNEGPTPGKTSPRERDSNGKDEVGSGTFEAE